MNSTLDQSPTETSFHHPCTILISGPTGCGKTRFVRRILEERLIEPFPTRLIWVYAEWQPEYEMVKVVYPETEFVNGYSNDLYNNLQPDERNLLIVDDQMSEASDAKSLVRLFTKGSHHRNLTIIYLVQNMFDQGKSSRTVSLNSHYNVAFRNLRDASQFRTLACQMMPHNPKWLMEAFADATSEPYGYMVIDNHPKSNPEFRFRSHIFPNEQTIFYSDSKSSYKRGHPPPTPDIPDELECPKSPKRRKREHP